MVLVDYGPDYAGIQGDGKEVGGLRREPEARTGGPLVILYSEDLERSLQAVTAAGGTILGRYTRFLADAGSTSRIRPATSSPSGPTAPPATRSPRTGSIATNLDLAGSMSLGGRALQEPG